MVEAVPGHPFRRAEDTTHESQNAAQSNKASLAKPSSSIPEKSKLHSTPAVPSGPLSISASAQAIGLSESLGISPVGDGIRVLHWDSRNLTGQQFSPSAGLIRQSLTSEESVLHVWSRTPDTHSSYTQSENIDWAYCTPIRSEACPGWQFTWQGILRA